MRIQHATLISFRCAATTAFFAPTFFETRPPLQLGDETRDLRAIPRHVDQGLYVHTELDRVERHGLEGRRPLVRHLFEIRAQDIPLPELEARRTVRLEPRRL